MIIVPTAPVPSQTLLAVLGGQSCRLDIFQKTTGLFLNLYVNDELCVGGVICEDANPLVRFSTVPFVGELAFYDLQGAEDPQFEGLGSRWVLGYE